MIIQTIKIGLPTFEIILPSDSSRTFEGPIVEEISKSSRSVNGTIHKDYISTKRRYNIEYGTISETDIIILENIYALQAANPELELNLIYANVVGTLTTVSVIMAPVSRGIVSPLDIFYYDGATIALIEV